MVNSLSIKKIKYFVLISIFCGSWPLFSFSQDGNDKVEANFYKKFADSNRQINSSDKTFYIVSSNSPLPADLHIVRPLDNKNAIVRFSSEEKFILTRQVAAVYPANDHWKFSPSAESILYTSNKKTTQFILSSLSIDTLINKLKSISGLQILSIDMPSASVVVETSHQIIQDKILPLNEVIFIDRRVSPKTEISIIGYNRSFHGINTLDYTIPFANGKNVVAGVKEQKMQEADIDLYKRVLPSNIAATTTSNHATVIASIIGGAGNSFYDARGIANACKFFPSSFENLFADDAAILATNKVTVQNHSYGTVVQSFYGAEAVSYDAQTWSNKNLLHVFSAGNRGVAATTDGRYANLPGFANLTGNFKMAKNIITVGAIDNKNIISAESSSGPLYDGRIAPQLIALGPNGTSDAAAMVSGTIAVMQQVYADSNSNSIPPASLIKSVLYNTADDVHNPGIDYKTGYGLLNSFEAVQTILQKKYDGNTVSQGQQWTKDINLSSNIAQLKITMSYTDSNAIVNNNKALINDLDLEVQEIGSGVIYKPWVLSVVANIDSLKKIPVRKRDSLNTTEQVSITLPAAGIYRIRVIGTSIVSASMPFHIAYHADTLNTFSFTNPQHSSDVNQQEDPNLSVKWKTFVADTNTTGNLFISYNSGANWQLLKAVQKIYTRQYTWPIKDTSSKALFKMETSFGDFLSKEFMIHAVTRPQVDFFCRDSFRLSWRKHLYATGYRLFTLADSAYLKPILHVTDTFVVMNRSMYPSLLYAVEPILSNGLPAARSMASEINQVGVSCFYKTLYYNLLDGNKADLVLELSIASYVDSIYFENVTASGQLIKTYGGVVAQASNTIYHQLIQDMTPGTTYLRARIKLQNGQTVYTEIISILTSGNRFILFYPNPSLRNGDLKYMLQQGIPVDSRLQLFDISGRLLKNYLEMPDKINVAGLSAGLFIYKLYSSAGVLLETGKIVLQ